MVRSKSLFVMALFLILSCVASCTDEDWAAFEPKTQNSPVIWEPGETWAEPNEFQLTAGLWPGTQYARASGVVTFRTASGPLTWCSASLIGSRKIATAHHCVGHLGWGGEVGFSPSFFDGKLNPAVRSQSNLSSIETGLQALGFRGVALTQAAHEIHESNNNEGNWHCFYDGQDGTSDVAYLLCDPKVLYDQSGIAHYIFPGDVFGYMDTKSEQPINDTPLYALTVNQKSGTANRKLLLSPNGKVQNRGATSCIPGYTNCTSQQGADTLPGSSGGAFLTLDDHMLFGVNSGSSSGNDRTPRCHGNHCLDHRGIVARVSGAVHENSHLSPLDSISSTPNTSYTSRLASSSQTRYDSRCANDEVMIGIIGAANSGFLNTTTVLNTLGSVCSRMIPGLGFQFGNDTYVQVRGGSQTSYYQTPSSTSNNRESLNRYRNTIPYSTWLVILPAILPQNTFLCPAGTALFKITGIIDNGTMVAIQSFGCRSQTSGDITLDIPSNALGNSLSPTTVTRSCGSNRVAMGKYQWVGTRIEDIQLACRDW